MSSPKIFISYSWTSTEHEQRVLDLATQLRDTGIDAILDKWDLREGEDADKFMERMVADAEVTKVLIVCDCKYAQKSNKREGGVGTEAQIISRKVYEQQDERKFVVASFEIDENTGKPVVPVYYGSRKYIDFTDSNRYAERFEELVRWVLDKPLYVKPKLGKIPDYLLSDENQSLGTSAAFHRVMHLLKEGRPNAKGALKEYLDVFATNLESFRIEIKHDSEPYYTLFLNNIETLLPYRNEWAAVLDSVCTYMQGDDWLSLYYTFFEAIHAYIKAPVGKASYYNREEENMKFLEGELFLYFLATLLKHDRVEEAADSLTHQFYDQTANVEFGAAMNYTGFYHSIYSFDDMSQAERSNLISIQSSVMINRARNCSVLNEVEVMQADMIAYFRYAISGEEDILHRWYPHTLLYASNRRAPFPLFARAVSARYLKRIALLLGVESREILKNKFEDLKNKKALPFWSMNYPSYSILMNLDYIGTK